MKLGEAKFFQLSSLSSLVSAGNLELLLGSEAVWERLVVKDVK